jgi:hypothetical protein
MNKTAIKAVGLFVIFLSVLALPAVASEDKLLYDQWMEVTMKGRKIGFSHQKAVSTDTGYMMTGKSVLKLEVSGTMQEISGSQTSFLDKEFRPLRFTYIQKEMNHQQYFEGVVEGKILNVTVRSGENVMNKTVALDDTAYISDAMALLLGQKKFSEGQKKNYRVFLEPLMAMEDVVVEAGKKTVIDINGKKLKVIPVTMKIKSIVTVSYISDEGRVVKEESPMGFVSEEVDEARAVSFPQGAMSFTSLLTYSLIPLEKPLQNYEKTTELKISLSGLSSKKLIPQDDRQKITASSANPVTLGLFIAKNSPASIKKLERPLSAQKFGSALSPSIESQSNDKEIMLMSAKIVGDEKDVYKAALKINKWVNEKVTKKYIDTFSAVETLKTLEGECQAHTNLFIALARAAGIPARPVAGIVYAEDFKGFLYHAWPEIYAGEWIALDPTFGEEIADATHIKLFDYDTVSQLQLYEYIGKLGIKIELVRY